MGILGEPVSGVGGMCDGAVMAARPGCRVMVVVMMTWPLWW